MAVVGSGASGAVAEHVARMPTSLRTGRSRRVLDVAPEAVAELVTAKRRRWRRLWRLRQLMQMRVRDEAGGHGTLGMHHQLAEPVAIVPRVGSQQQLMAL